MFGTGKSLFVALVMAIISSPIIAAEYSDEDILPDIKEILFSNESIGFIAAGVNYPKKKGESYFLLFRNKELGQEVELEEFRSIFAVQMAEISVITKSKEILLTSDGFSYEVDSKNRLCEWVADVSEYGKKYTSSLDDKPYHTMKSGNEIIPTHVHLCNQINAVEHVNENLWIGTGYGGDHGNHVGQGVVIQNRKTGELVKKLKEMGAWTNQIKLDPYSGDVWVASSHIINHIAGDGNPVSKYQFFKEFDSSTGMPRFSLSSKMGQMNPLAVIASYMTDDNAKAMAKLSKSFPKDDAYTFSLYNFHMCCGFRPNKYFPESMNAMVPLIINELQIVIDKLALIEGTYHPEVDFFIKRWTQTLCEFDDPLVLPFIESIDVQKTGITQEFVNSCMAKLQAERI
jgi:hypothetical protein